MRWKKSIFDRKVLTTTTATTTARTRWDEGKVERRFSMSFVFSIFNFFFGLRSISSHVDSLPPPATRNFESFRTKFELLWERNFFSLLIARVGSHSTRKSFCLRMQDNLVSRFCVWWKSFNGSFFFSSPSQNDITQIRQSQQPPPTHIRIRKVSVRVIQNEIWNCFLFLLCQYCLRLCCCLMSPCRGKWFLNWEIMKILRFERFETFLITKFFSSPTI